MYWWNLLLQIIFTMFEKVWMSEGAGLAKVPRWNSLWFQTSWFHENASALAPRTSCRQQHNTDGRLWLHAAF